MILQRLIFFLLLLILPQLLASQVSHRSHSFTLNYDPVFSNRFPDTLGIQPSEIKLSQNQVVQSKWISAAIIPVGLITAGTITILVEPYCKLSKYKVQDKVYELFPNFHSSLDNYLQFAPLAAVFGLKAAGVKSRSDFLNQVVISAKAELLMTAIVGGMKRWISSERPSGSGLNSMPSGHTAQAFVSATILDMEYHDTSPWISVSGYAVATTTAVFRMANNQHWISDVLIGAGIGIFSTKVIYFTHRYQWGKKSNVVILPAIYRKGGGVSFAMLL
jgi:membrane-associated phospholipid phosphatase